MKLIQPSEISGRILTLLDDSDERVILVSPYLKVSKWYKFINKVNGLITRGINLEIYVRDDPDNTATYNDLNQLELTYRKVPHLHSKVYLNERYGIVTSMNLLLSSEINSLEIGYSTENWTEYKSLLDYYQRYIHVGQPVQYKRIQGQPAADLNEIMISLREELRRTKKNAWLWFENKALHVSTGWNNYRISIIDGYLRITVLLRITSTTEPKTIQFSSVIAKKVGDLTAMKIDISPESGPSLQPGILQLTAQAQYFLKSSCISVILEVEATYIMNSIIRFVSATEDLTAQ